MKNRLVVMLAGLCLAALTGCGNANLEPQELPADMTEAEAAVYACPVCPIAPEGPSAQKVTHPVKDEVSGLYICPDPCGGGGYCGDGYCDPYAGESSSNCSWDCGSSTWCGDGVCNGSETSSSCPGDCGPSTWCGDGVCNGGETSSSCPGDCGSSGGYCGDGLCALAERDWCTSDCGYVCRRPPCPLEP